MSYTDQSSNNPSVEGDKSTLSVDEQMLQFYSAPAIYRVSTSNSDICVEVPLEPLTNVDILCEVMIAEGNIDSWLRIMVEYFKRGDYMSVFKIRSLVFHDDAQKYFFDAKVLFSTYAIQRSLLNTIDIAIQFDRFYHSPSNPLSPLASLTRTPLQEGQEVVYDDNGVPLSNDDLDFLVLNNNWSKYQSEITALLQTANKDKHIPSDDVPTEDPSQTLYPSMTLMNVFALIFRAPPSSPTFTQNLAAAAKDLVSAIATQPDYANFHLLLGQIRHAQGDVTEALRLISHALILNPLYPARVRVMLGHIYYRLKNYTQAKLCYQRAVHMDSRCIEALCGLINIEFIAYRDRPEAVPDSNKFLSLLTYAANSGVSHPLVNLHVGDHMLAQYKLTHAIGSGATSDVTAMKTDYSCPDEVDQDCLQTLLTSSPIANTINKVYVQAYHVARQRRSVLGRDYTLASIRAKQASIYHHIGNYSVAKLYYSAALRLDKTNVVASVGLAQCLIKQQDWFIAREVLTKAVVSVFGLDDLVSDSKSKDQFKTYLNTKIGGNMSQKDLAHILNYRYNIKRYTNDSTKCDDNAGVRMYLYSSLFPVSTSTSHPYYHSKGLGMLTWLLAKSISLCDQHTLKHKDSPTSAVPQITVESGENYTISLTPAYDKYEAVLPPVLSLYLHASADTALSGNPTLLEDLALAASAEYPIVAYYARLYSGVGACVQSASDLDVTSGQSMFDMIQRVLSSSGDDVVDDSLSYRQFANHASTCVSLLNNAELVAPLSVDSDSSKTKGMLCGGALYKEAMVAYTLSLGYLYRALNCPSEPISLVFKHLESVTDYSGSGSDTVLHSLSANFPLPLPLLHLPNSAVSLLYNIAVFASAHSSSDLNPSVDLSAEEAVKTSLRALGHLLVQHPTYNLARVKRIELMMEVDPTVAMVLLKTMLHTNTDSSLNSLPPSLTDDSFFDDFNTAFIDHKPLHSLLLHNTSLFVDIICLHAIACIAHPHVAVPQKPTASLSLIQQEIEKTFTSIAQAYGDDRMGDDEMEETHRLKTKQLEELQYDMFTTMFKLNIQFDCAVREKVKMTTLQGLLTNRTSSPKTKEMTNLMNTHRRSHRTGTLRSLDKSLNVLKKESHKNNVAAFGLLTLSLFETYYILYHSIKDKQHAAAVLQLLHKGCSILVDVDPTNYDYKLNLAHVLYLQARYQEALKLYLVCKDKIVRKLTTFTKTHVNMSSEVLHERVYLDNALVDINTHIARAYYQDRQNSSAVMFLKENLKIMNDDVNAYNLAVIMEDSAITVLNDLRQKVITVSITTAKQAAEYAKEALSIFKRVRNAGNPTKPDGTPDTSVVVSGSTRLLANKAAAHYSFLKQNVDAVCRFVTILEQQEEKMETQRQIMNVNFQETEAKRLALEKELEEKEAAKLAEQQRLALQILQEEREHEERLRAMEREKEENIQRRKGNLPDFADDEDDYTFEDLQTMDSETINNVLNEHIRTKGRKGKSKSKSKSKNKHDSDSENETEYNAYDDDDGDDFGTLDSKSSSSDRKRTLDENDDEEGKTKRRRVFDEED